MKKLKIEVPGAFVIDRLYILCIHVCIYLCKYSVIRQHLLNKFSFNNLPSLQQMHAGHLEKNKHCDRRRKIVVLIIVIGLESTP